MKIRNVLTPNVIKVPLESTSKEEIIAELLDLLVATGKVSDRDAAFQALMERERKMSTGLQEAVAVPHAKTNTVKSLAAAIGIKPEGVEFDALDGQPSKIFIMTLSPIDRVGPHVQFLAEVSRIIKSKEARERLLHAQTAKEVLAVFGI